MLQTTPYNALLAEITVRSASSTRSPSRTVSTMSFSGHIIQIEIQGRNVELLAALQRADLLEPISNPWNAKPRPLFHVLQSTDCR